MTSSSLTPAMTSLHSAEATTGSSGTPGDGDDTVDGEAGTDTLEFNGAGGVDIMTITTLEEGGLPFLP